MKNMKTMVVGGVALALAAMAASIYTVDAREVAVVLSFGAPVRTVTEPGLYICWPWPVQQVVRFDSRARLLEVSPAELLTKDKKNLVVEAFAIWTVDEPQTFLEAFRNPNADEVRWEDLVVSAEIRLSDLVTSRIAAALAQKEFVEFLSVESSTEDLLPADVAVEVAGTAGQRFGIHVQDVRLRHLGLPLQNEQSIYERMRAERLRIANAYRSEGEEKATTLRADADRQAAEILAEADKEAAMVLAEAEAAAARLYAETYRQDPEFYTYLRDLESVTTLVAEEAGGDGADPRRTILILDSQAPPFDALYGEGR